MGSGPCAAALLLAARTASARSRCRAGDGGRRLLRPTPDPRNRGWLLCVQGIRISRPQALAHIDPIPDYIQNSSDGFVKRALTMWESATILESPFHSERSWKPSSRLPCWLACSPVACTLGDSPANGPHSSRLTCAAAGCSRRSTEPRPRPSPGLPAGPAPAGEPCGRGAPLAGPARPRRSHASTRALAPVCPCRAQDENARIRVAPPRARAPARPGSRLSALASAQCFGVARGAPRVQASWRRWRSLRTPRRTFSPAPAASGPMPVDR